MSVIFSGCKKEEEPDKPEYAITLSDDGNGTAKATVKGNDVAEAVEGAAVTLTATPTGDYAFKQWNVIKGGVTLSPDATTNPATFIMGSQRVEVKAGFEAISRTITITDDGNGTAKADPADAAEGQFVKITATPDTYYKLKKWTLLSGGVTLNTTTVSPATFLMGSQPVEIKAEFEYVDPLKAAFPDAAFRAWMAKKYDTDGSGILSDEELEVISAEEVVDLRDGGQGPKDIVDITGIELFTALTELNVGQNKLRSLDVSKNTGLKRLECQGLTFAELDLTKNTKLEYLDCSSGALETLDVSGCSALKSLSCQKNRLRSFKISGCNALERVFCQTNSFTTLDLSACPNLNTLYCGQGSYSPLRATVPAGKILSTPDDQGTLTIRVYRSDPTVYADYYTAYGTQKNDVIVYEAK